jgi:hypothetical protein
MIITRWFSKEENKRETEIFFLKWSLGWITIFSIVVTSKIYLNFLDKEYLILSLICSFPFFLFPLLFPLKSDRYLKLTERYWFKVVIFLIIIFYYIYYLFIYLFFLYIIILKY